MRNKPLSMMGWDTNPVITDILPTNLPAIKVDELRLDDLFLVNDGGAVLVDYESSAKEKNVFKYLNYIPRISETNPEIFKDGKLHIFILYTADVKPADVKTEYDFGCIKLHIEAAFLNEVNPLTIDIFFFKWKKPGGDGVCKACQEDRGPGTKEFCSGRNPGIQ